MNKELARRWVAALRSGEYAQCRGQLGRTRAGKSEYCCLGVLCEVVEPAMPAPMRRVIGEEDAEADDWSDLYYGYAGSMPPYQVEAYLGVDTWKITVPADQVEAYWRDDDEDGFVSVSLDALNDVAGWSFDQIADAIERHYGLAEVTV